MQRTPTTPDADVEERRTRVGQERPSVTSDQGISVKTVGERAKAAPPGTISLEEAKELLGDSNLTDKEIDEIKEQARLLVEVIYEKWLQDRNKDKRGE